MKALLVFLSSLFFTVILLVAGFQLVQLLLNELTAMIGEAWRKPELPSTR